MLEIRVINGSDKDVDHPQAAASGDSFSLLYVKLPKRSHKQIQLLPAISVSVLYDKTHFLKHPKYLLCSVMLTNVVQCLR
jgi:hypothetical protein